jgi:hypothetical protein
VLLDLTRQTLHVLVDECRHSLVVRTLGYVEHADQGMVFHYDTTERATKVTAIPASAKLIKGALQCYETRIPIEKAAATYGRQGKPISTERFEAATLHAISRDGKDLWRIQLRVTIHKEKWLVGVYGGPDMVEFAAFTAKDLRAGHYDMFPLNRVDTAPEKIDVASLNFVPAPAVRNVWTMLRDDSEE